MTIQLLYDPEILEDTEEENNNEGLDNEEPDEYDEELDPEESEY